MTLLEKATAEKQRIQNELQSIKNKLRHLPEGTLYIEKNGKYYKWFQKTDNKPIYIKKKNEKTAADLALKTYYIKQSEALTKELQAIEAYLRQHQPEDWLIENQNSEFQRLLAAAGQDYGPFSDAAAPDGYATMKEWQDAPYEGNPSYPEHLRITSLSGRKMRSKSEIVIEMILLKYDIPYRYENPLYTLSGRLYPDFTILHPDSGEFWYWEHFGKMDDPSYVAKQVLPKLQFYYTHGILPGINLIQTYETYDKPIQANEIEMLVKHYFI